MPKNADILIRSFHAFRRDIGRRSENLYCGAAVWERELATYQNSDEAWNESLAFTRRQMECVGRGECANTAFWRLFDAASALVLGSSPLVRRAEQSVWTNLSKIGEEGAPAPVSDLELQRMDVAQLALELEELKPDVVLCVSGSMLVDTGNEAFQEFERIEVALQTPNTLLKVMPHAGMLLWTMHPNRKSEEWRATLLGDLKTLTVAG